MPNVVYAVGVNDAAILAALNRIDKNLAQIAQSGQNAFNQVQKSADVSGTQIGLVSGVVSSLVTEFINLGKQAVDVLANIAEESVQTALEFDVLKARLTGIFGKENQAAADETFTFIQKKSKELGIDLGELAGAFIPKTESLAQFEKVAKIATALARSDPEQGAIGARIALIEALSGTFTSLQRRFEIPKQDIDQLKEAFDTGGIEAFLTKFEEVLGKAGKSFDDLNDTAQMSFNKLGEEANQALGGIGAPIVEELKSIADELLKFLGENETEIKVFVDSVGDAGAEILKFIAGFADLDQITPETIIELGEKVFDFVKGLEAAGTLIGRFLAIVGQLFVKLGEFVAVFNPISALLKVFGVDLGDAGDSISGFFDKLFKGDTFFTKFLDFLNQAQAGLTGLSVVLQDVTQSAVLLTEALAAAASGDFDKAFELNAKSQEIFNRSIEDGRKATREAYAEGKKAIDEYTSSVTTHAEEQQKLKDSIEDSASAGTDQADAALAAAAANREAAEAAEKLKDAQDKVNKAMAEAEKDFQRKLEDIDIETERKRLDIAIEFAQKREDAARDNLRKLVDIQKKYAQDVDDAARDLTRKEEDIARKFGEQRIDLEREQRQKRVDIERDFRLKLQDIQKQFLLDAEEAEQNRDAVAFLKALKARDEKVKDAQTDRQREIEETQITGERKREELEIQRQREIEDARIANERKLEDLKINLDRQIEAQNEAYSRQLEDLAIGEQRKNEELNRQREQDIEDAKRAYDRKLEDLQTSLADELAIIQDGNAAIEEEQRRHLAVLEELAARQAELQRQGIGSSANTPTHPAAGSGGAQGRHPGDIPGFAGGGFIGIGQEAIVGERGPELATTTSSGTKITPNFMPPNLANTNVDNSRNINQNLGILDPSGITPTMIALARQVALQVVNEVL